MKEVGERLKNLRKEHGFTQRDIADFIDMSQSQIAKVETGERNLKLTKLSKLCGLYGVNEEYILYGEECDQPKVYVKKCKGLSIETMYRMNKICRNLKEMQDIYEAN